MKYYRLFKNARFMAMPPEGTDPIGNGGGGGGGNPEEHNNEPNGPTLEEALAELAKERASNAKNKAALDKALSENGNLTKQLRTKMTAEEQEAEIKKAADEAKDARLAELETQLRTMNYSKRFMGMGMDEKTAEALSDTLGDIPDPDKFFSDLDKFIKVAVKKAGEESLQQFLKDRPDIKAGNGDPDKNTLAQEKAKRLAHRNVQANTDILSHYIQGGKK